MRVFKHIFPNLEDWPIYKLASRRTEFIQDIEKCTWQKFEMLSAEDIHAILRRSAYMEVQRLKTNEWKVDPPKERQFWSKVQKRLEDIELESEEGRGELENLYSVVINRYAQEIVGNFKIGVFKFARIFLTAFFHRIFCKISIFKPSSWWPSRKSLYKQMRLYGENVELVRDLAKRGTVVLVPTHFSNLDSILLGYYMDSKVGLPSFSYGAGLNLFNNSIVAYFMNRLGAYRIDRRKRNQIYLETLKCMSEISIYQNTNSLFFLGGTRSRSGSLEKKLKLGLLGTTISSQRRLIQEKSNRKIFVVPVIISYNSVLEAKSLIFQHLKQKGKEKFSVKRPKTGLTFRRILTFIYRLFSRSSEVHLSFGTPLDVIGNDVNQKGESIDNKAKLIDIELYFKSEGKIAQNEQSEQIYTQKLADRVLKEYYKHNLVLASHMVAYCAINYFVNTDAEGDLFDWLRDIWEDSKIDKLEFESHISTLLKELRLREGRAELRLTDRLKSESTQEIIDFGIRMLNSYHGRRVLFLDKYGQYKTEDPHLLYYYHNRMSGYNILKDL